MKPDDPQIDPNAPPLEPEPTIADDAPRALDTDDPIEALGMLQFLPAEIAIIMADQTLEDAIAHPGTPQFDSYQRGRLLADAEVRRAVFAQAKSGSTPAQKQFFDLAERARNAAPVQNDEHEADSGTVWE